MSEAGDRHRALIANSSYAIIGYVPSVGGRNYVKYQDGATFFTHANPLGSTGLITDAANHIVQDELFYPFGQQWAKWLNWGTLYSEQFASLNERDSESGLDPTPNRMYTSQYGRWLSPDPLAGDITNPQSLNRYAYVLNNPTSFVDPLGLRGATPCTMADSTTTAGCAGRGGWSGAGGTAYTVDGFAVPASMAQALLASGGAVQCPNNICYGVNRDNLPVNFVATTQGGYYACEIPGEWPSRNAAGTAAVDCTAGEARVLGVEVGGDVNKLPNGEFTFGGVVTGTDAEVDIPYDSNTVAIFNIEVTGYLPEYIGYQDIGTQNDFNMALYRGTPAGRVELYDPTQAGQFPGGCVLVGASLPPIPPNYLAGMPACH